MEFNMSMEHNPYKEAGREDDKAGADTGDTGY